MNFFGAYVDPNNVTYPFLINLQIISIFLKVTVRCGCQTLKKEWLCQDVQAAYRGAGSDPKDVYKSQYGLGLLPCNSGCRSKVQVTVADLQQRKSPVSEVIHVYLRFVFSFFLIKLYAFDGDPNYFVRI